MKKIEKKFFSFPLFEKALSNKGLNERQFALKIGISPATVNNWHHVQNIKKIQFREAIERILGVKYEDLCVPAAGVPPEGITNVEPVEADTDNGIHDHNREWPIVGTSAAGPQLSAIPVSEYPGVADDWERLPEGFKCPDPNGFALRITGDSMEPKLPNGSIVFVAPNIQPQNGDVALVIIEGRGGGRESCVKQIYDTGESLKLHSYNESKYPDKLVSKKYILDKYKVVAFRYTVSGTL